jgi:hypothetical protein
VLPLAQLALSRTFGIGNESVVIGRGDWLYYRPAIDYLTGPKFLAPGQLARRAASGDEWTSPPQPDPVEAIVTFNAALAARGVTLILMPVPVKASLDPDHLASASARDPAVLHNPSYDDFVESLKAKGIRVFDPADRLASFARTHGASAYLTTDTHWTPAAMESIAAALSDELRALLPARPTTAAFRRDATMVTSLGDLGKLLNVPANAYWPARETLEIHPVRPTDDGPPQVIDPASDVLLLGDSFANIYSLESMGWGESAGLAEHLALALNRPVDAIRRNDAGAYATRELLARDVRDGCRLEGKKVVIWEFAERELAQGDWKVFDLPPATGIGATLCGATGLRAAIGAHARMVWTQAVDPNDNDTFGVGSGFRLMGLDTDDGLGIREIVPGPLAARKPMLTPDGQRVVFTDFVDGRVGVVNWDGTGRRYVADGVAADVLTDPGTGRTWVYAVTGPVDPERSFSGTTLVRFDLDRPGTPELVWDQTAVAVDNFQVSDDGRYAAGQFPWPDAGFADLREGTWTKFADGCWTSLAPDGSNVAWVFDGAHRGLIFQDPASGAKWTVPINQAPGLGGFEVYHPRWANQRRFFSMSGPYAEGEGANRIGRRGTGVEIYVGRFSADFQRVERWVQITANGLPDFFPDLWIDPATPPSFDPADVEAPRATTGAAAGPVVVDAKLTAVTRLPTLRSIAPYRQALVVYEYDVVRVRSGIDPGPRILVHHWALRDDEAVAPTTRVGETVRLDLDPFDAHPELEGERVVQDMEDAGLPKFYEPPR